MINYLKKYDIHFCVFKRKYRKGIIRITRQKFKSTSTNYAIAVNGYEKLKELTGFVKKE
ncbi:MAG: hypothetical protein AABY32_00890 [Nanoarchaeota archaeon]